MSNAAPGVALAPILLAAQMALITACILVRYANLALLGRLATRSRATCLHGHVAQPVAVFALSLFRVVVA